VQPDQRSQDLVDELEVVVEFEIAGADVDKNPEGQEKVGGLEREGIENLEPRYLTRSRDVDAKPTTA
jgi:hypothetical protein